MKRIYYLAFLIVLGSLFSILACQDSTFSQGKEQYTKLCSNCHGASGEGLQGLIPPLAQSDYLKEHKNMVACIIKNGLTGDIKVLDKTYNQPMPALVKNLTPADISNIANYILGSWGNNYGEVTLKEVEQQLEGCKREKY